jgi:hypothetical protein
VRHASVRALAALSIAMSRGVIAALAAATMTSATLTFATLTSAALAFAALTLATSTFATSAIAAPAPDSARVAPPAATAAPASVAPAPSTGSTAPAQAPGSTTPAPPSGIELLHLTPAGQPPLDVLDFDNFDEVKSAFNDAADRTRMIVMVSPMCPHCLNGASLIQKVLEDSAAARVRVIVVWMRVVHSDRTVTQPNSLVLARIMDRRAIQFWDPDRMLSKRMMAEIPRDSAMAMADTSGGSMPIIWDIVAMWRPGVTWTDRLPAPDFQGHPIAAVMDPFRRRFGELTRMPAPAK